MTTSPETADLDHPALRRLVDEANAMRLADRVTLLKALIPQTAKQLTPVAFEELIIELRLKGERLYDALSHPGHGRRDRHVMGERDFEGR